jgi:integrase/recombinase XerC
MRKETALVPIPVRYASTSLSLPSPGRRLVEAFLSGRNARTLEAYGRDLEDFRAFVGATTVDAAAGELLGRGHGEANALALAYKTSLVERKLAAATVNRRLAALRSLVKLARTLGMVPWTLEVESVKGESYRDTRGPGRGSVRRMLERLDVRLDAKGRRDRALLRLLFDLALRRGEVVSLDLEHVDLEGGTVAVLGKGRQGRAKVTLPDATKAALAAWVAVRGADAGALFLSLDRASHGHRLTGRAVYKIVRELGEDLDLRVRPHGLRHAAITEALELTGGNVRAVQRFSRHRDLRVLTVYDDNRADLAGEVASLVSGTA